MSKAKFDAVKELIQEKRYSEARNILKTINHPTAQKWLLRLDEIAPEFPSTPSNKIQIEQEKYYKRENRKARANNFVSGIKLIGSGILCFIGFAIFNAPVPQIGNTPTSTNGFAFIFIILGVIAILLGILKMNRKV